MFDQCLRYRAQSTPSEIAMVTPQGDVSYASLYEYGRRMETALIEAGVRFGQTVLVSDSRPFMHWIILFALEAIGCTSVSEDARGNASATMIFDALVTENAPSKDFPLVIRSTQEWMAAVMKLQPTKDARDLPRTAKDIVRILLTSGTTGEVRHVPFTRAMMDAHVATICVDTLRPKARMLSTMGIDSLGGYLISYSVWNTGGAMLYGATPADALETLKTDFMLMAPIQLQYLLASLPADAPRRDGLRIGVGGSNLPRRLYEEAVHRLTNDIVIAYGSTEVGYVTGGPAALGLTSPGAAGYALPGAQISIVDDAGNPVLDGAIGIIRLSTPGIAAGYLQHPDSKAFRDGWFYPGDHGALRSDGLLVLEGRDDDVLNIGGVKISAWTVEEAILRDEFILEAAAFTLPDPQGIPILYVAVVLGPDTELAIVAEAASLRISHDMKLVRLAALPRNPIGKVRRNALRSEVGRQLNIAL